jgi:hypothetical protein
MFIWQGTKHTLLPPCSEQSVSIQALEGGSGRSWIGSSDRFPPGGAGCRIVIQISRTDADGTPADTKAKCPQPARIYGIPNRALADAEQRCRFGNRKKWLGMLLRTGAALVSGKHGRQPIKRPRRRGAPVV